jgi:5-methylcytosine-specific restriction protein A
MCIILYLIIEDVEWVSDDELGREEGSIYADKIYKYERSRYNRALCLKYYGFMCRGCGETLGEKYGPIGSNVIHVHHIVPLSEMGSAYKLNPIKDLVPLCPNCHNIVHRKSPPLTIRELNSLTNFVEENL